MRLRHPLRAGIATLAATAALGAASALPTMADTTASPGAAPISSSSPTQSPSPDGRVGGCSGSSAAILACIKSRAATAISNRETALQEMTTDIDSSADITPGDKSTLLGQIQADQSGLTTLNGTIQGDTTPQQAWTDAQTIVTGYRVYLLEAPKVHLVIAADTEAVVESLISSVMPAIKTAIDDSTAPAAAKAQAQAAYNDCSTQLAAAQSASSGIVSAVIELQPSGYPGNQPTLASARGSAQTARQDLGASRSDLNKIRSLLGF